MISFIRFYTNFISENELFNSLKSFESFVNFMHRPVSGSSLGVTRMLFGLLMVFDIVEERSGFNLRDRWDSRYCNFPLFSFLKPFPLEIMVLLYGIMWLGALGMTFGYRHKISFSMFIIPYWYVFLLDKSSWNNHSYLYGLLSTILLVTDSNKFCSVDNYHLTKDKAVVPYWNYFLVKFQFFILYFNAGLKKLNFEWLSGYAMENLSLHWVFSPFRVILGAYLTNLIIIHWIGALFDLTVFFFLINKSTRLMATFISLSFHLMNSQLFNIGMFPYVCIAGLPIFYSFEWPEIVYETKCHFKCISCTNDLRSKDTTTHVTVKSQFSNSTENKSTTNGKSTAFLLLTYCSIQLFLPYSHFITKGYNSWTNGLYGYSWDMMVYAWETTSISVKLVDNLKNVSYFMEPYAFVRTDRWSKHPDMAIQYAYFIKKSICESHDRKAKTMCTSNISIYFDVWCSVNGRFQQRFFKPDIDILAVEWSPFKSVSFVLPVLSKFTNHRTRLNQITEDVLSWGNNTDVMFIADFPGYRMDNFVSPDLENITLSILDGKVEFREESMGQNESMTLETGNRVAVSPNTFHEIITTGSNPSTFMYTYVNKTARDESIADGKVSVPETPHKTVIEDIFMKLRRQKLFVMDILSTVFHEVVVLFM